MPVTRLQLENALRMYLDDYVTNDESVTLEEMDTVKKSFDMIWDDLREDAEEEVEDE